MSETNMRSTRDKKNIFRAEEGLTEVLDFTITLGIMVLALAVIGLAGYPLVTHMKDMGQLENIEQSFSVLQPNMNKVVYGKAPSQSVELKMYGGMLAITGTSSISVNMSVWNESAGMNDEIEIQRQLRMIENDFKDTSICYENTGVWAKYPQGKAIAISKPDLAFDDKTLVIPMVTISGSSSISGSGLVRVISDGGQLSINRMQNVSSVSIVIVSDYYEGWEKYLDDDLGMQITNIDAANNTVFASRDYSPNIDVLVSTAPMSVTVE